MTFSFAKPNGIVLAPRLAARRDALGAGAGRRRERRGGCHHPRKRVTVPTPDPTRHRQTPQRTRPRVHAPADPLATDTLFGRVSCVRARRSEADEVFGCRRGNTNHPTSS